MTDRISTAELRKLLAEVTDGPWGFSLCTCGHPSCDQHVMNNQGSVGFSPEDARLIATAPDLAAEVIRLREALEPFAEAADGRKSKNISGSHCFGQAHLLKARAALNHKETDNE